MTSAPASRASARLATRLAFFAAGFSIACWAPLIPFAKANLNANEAQFGLLLLCLGVGSLLTMPIAGALVARRGAGSIAVVSGLAAALMLPVLATVDHFLLGAVALFLFGAALGSLDVAMNVHGAQVERLEKRPLMSGFHAQFSLGGLCGAGLGTSLLIAGLTPLLTAAICGLLVLALVLVSAPRFLIQRSDEHFRFTFPHGIVLILSALTAVTFLVEGAILDWGALLLIELGIGTPKNAGLGFFFFSGAMVVARLSGDATVSTFGEPLILSLSGLLAAVGVVIILLSSSHVGALLGFVIVGLGAANVAPILFSKAGRQTIMPVGLAVASVTTIGYGGHMIGPALVGFAAQETSLSTVFWALAGLMLLVSAAAAFPNRRNVTPTSSQMHGRTK